MCLIKVKQNFKYDNCHTTNMNKTTSQALSFRISKPLMAKMEKYCQIHEITQSEFIRTAIQEKLLRNSIEENVIIRANTIEVEHLLQDYMVLIENNFQKIRDQIQDLMV